MTVLSLWASVIPMGGECVLKGKQPSPHNVNRVSLFFVFLFGLSPPMFLGNIGAIDIILAENGCNRTLALQDDDVSPRVVRS